MTKKTIDRYKLHKILTPTSLKIIEYLTTMDDELCSISDLSKKMNVSLPSLSNNLRKLYKYDILKRREFMHNGKWSKSYELNLDNPMVECLIKNVLHMILYNHDLK